MILNIYI